MELSKKGFAMNKILIALPYSFSWGGFLKVVHSFLYLCASIVLIIPFFFEEFREVYFLIFNLVLESTPLAEEGASFFNHAYSVLVYIVGWISLLFLPAMSAVLFCISFKIYHFN